MAIHLRAAVADDAPALTGLLETHHLPLDGVADRVPTTLVAEQEGRLVGTAALELFVGGALLRSVVVDTGAQTSGIGRRLTEAALLLATTFHVPAVYLLTTTADQYFMKFGFSAITRVEVPATVKASFEFTTACPSSATVMRKRL